MKTAKFAGPLAKKKQPTIHITKKEYQGLKASRVDKSLDEQFKKGGLRK